LKRLTSILLTASIAIGSAFVGAGTSFATPMPEAVAADTAKVIQVRSDDHPPYRWDGNRRHYDRRDWRRHDDRRYWHRERWREREWRRDRYWRHRRGPSIILDF
jgi:hypothetical protein